MSQRVESPRLRLGVLGIVVIALFVPLFARLWYLQVLSSESFTEAAEANRIRVVQVEAPRGRILDRDGTVLVDNRVSIVVTVDRVRFAELEDADRTAMLERLAAELSRYGSPATVEQLQDRVDDVRYSRYAPVPVAEDATEELKIYIEEHQELFPSVAVERVAVRRYPYGTRAAHVIGSVGEINDEELEERANKPKTYIRGNQIGKTGVERIYEDDLRGMPGQTVFEVDAMGDPVRILEDLSTPPIPGDDVWLTIDIETQALSEDLLAQALEDARNRRVSGDNLPNRGNAGSVVVTDPRNGEVLAMASYPVFDPADFVNGISSTRWEFLNSDEADKPILNRAIQGVYAPGSTYKLFTGLAAMVHGLRTPDQPFLDQGTFTIEDCRGPGCTFRNAGSKAYGTVDMRRAMTVSSDAYFYSIGADFWNNRGRLGDEAQQETIRTFGFGQETGVPLPSEQDGRVPTPQQRKAQYEANPELFLTGDWFTGDNVIMTIGQGDVGVTPLQLANGYATFANGGTRYAPNIARKITRSGSPDTIKRSFEPRINGRVEMDPVHRQALLDGLIGVTTRDGGTARATFAGFPNDTFPVAGKTGTAEVDGKADTALFAAFGPAPAPEFQVAIVLEESGFGGTAAAPVARALFDVFAGVAPMPVIQPGGALVEPPLEGAEVDDTAERPADRLGQIAEGGAD
ncbi:MAG TPA: penicillin-binding protein 2 [Acidimicrobiaceae bacterium]|nr:penicillin-binding protein 2 [Acidimicrobiaceae bacterium]